ncbi:MAG: tRNA (adenosine(37)-N6)-dimethylallyltransferase MiaA [Anaerolineales bacterium]
MNKPLLILLVGATAVGKTELSLQLAESLNAEIISADSRLLYRGMDIGTAKPTPAERARVPHHLIDVANPNETWSLTQYQHAAAQAICQIDARGRIPLLVGGTGQYVRALTEGWQPPAQQPHPRLRAALEAWAAQIGAQELHRRLSLLDPQAAAAIQWQNLRRTVRALEVIFSTGKRFSEQRRRTESPYRLLTIGLTRSRPELYARIDARIQTMLATGLIDEVRGLLAHGYGRDLPAMSAIGYREIAAHLAGEITLEEATTQMKRLTRQFVRRQANWFSPADPQIHWFALPNDQILSQITQLILRAA